MIANLLAGIIFSKCSLPQSSVKHVSKDTQCGLSTESHVSIKSTLLLSHAGTALLSYASNSSSQAKATMFNAAASISELVVLVFQQLNQHYNNAHSDNHQPFDCCKERSHLLSFVNLPASEGDSIICLIGSV